MKIIGISYNYDSHDNSMAFIRDGEIIFAEAEERLSRIKHDGSFPKRAIENCLKRNGVSLEEIDYFAAGFPPIDFKKFILGHFERSVFDPFVFLLWMLIRSPKTLYKLAKERFGRLLLKKDVAEVEFDLPAEKLVLVDHERAHIISAYRTSGLDECIGVALDGAGSTVDGKFISGAVCLCRKGSIQLAEVVPYFASLGTLYEAISVFLGFDMGDGAGKTMGLASYGNPDNCYSDLATIAPYYKDNKWHIDKSWWIDYMALSRIKENKKLFLNTRTGRFLTMLNKKHTNEDIAAAAQKIMEDRVMDFIKCLTEKYGSKKLVCAGGVFFNIKMNRRLLDSRIVDSLHVFPNAGDGGCSVGAALGVYYDKVPTSKNDYKIKSMALGSDFNNDAIEKELINFGRIDSH